MGTILVAFIVFGLLVVFHELGHFTVAKFVGIKVHEFAIGMGPRFLKVKKGETEYSLRILPIGGYVKMEGEDEASTDAGSFNNKPIWARMAVLIAGPFMNFVLAVLLFTMIFYSLGFPTTIIDRVTPGFPAEQVGLRPGDQITSINGENITNWDQIVRMINGSREQELSIILLREGAEKQFRVTPVINRETDQAIIGITPAAEKSLVKSITTSIDRMFFIMGGMMEFLGNLFGGKASTEDVVGPVGIIHLVGEAAKTSIYNVMSLAALISINLGIVNLIPIPALDGGRLLFLLFEGISGRPIDPEKEGFIHLVGFVLLMVLMLFIAYKDIIRFDLF
ncbi:regulator of sigma E protease [Geosporobacter subterraneus DSM 17957]|uniref:Zinc metalloprotease n=1 Tax=Geosporobacter subterraneus DSM 17957 TaxID=1121919 RepID=A0A1M6E1E0_9FIRM|nr:RIP metalloprotease RseP [Geosporobacter subterraneus]SHI79190.1 regulator of sigma E protease [Geosporobacter subterraneus DSM 17957]